MGRQKRSISLPEDLATEIEDAAATAGVSVSAWIAEMARHRLRIEAGRRGVEEYERENGAFTEEEKAAARARLREMLDAAARAAEHNARVRAEGRQTA